jgi:hypothetical protein
MRRLTGMFGQYPPFGGKPVKKDPSTEVPDAPPEDWGDPLVGMRIDRFMDLGFDMFESLELALHRDVSWTDALALMEKGASHEQTLAILK